MGPERRLHPRFNLAVDVSLELESGGQLHRFQTRSVNVSRGGMQVKACRSIMELFQSQEDYPHVCMLAFTLPQGKQKLIVKCHMVTHRRLSQNEFHLSLQFAEFEKNGRSTLENYLPVLRANGGLHPLGVQQQHQQGLQQS